METSYYLKKLVEELHSAAVATIASDGHPHICIIDMMLWDDGGVYFLTAKGKDFYAQLMEQKYIALSATDGKISVSLRGKIQNIGYEKLDEIFEKNTYMQKIYPDGSRDVLQVFRIYEAQGEYFDISNPAEIFREDFAIGNEKAVSVGYFAGDGCIGCNNCYSVCPQKCIDITKIPVVIDQNHCIRCGHCAESCPHSAICKN